LLVVAAPPAQAASFVGTQTGPSEWTYTLTYDPQDNYGVSACGSSTASITLSGLTGVVSATPPSATDFDDPTLSATNLAWTPQVSSGGTVVTWTHQGSGTGNFNVAKHVFGFKVTAATPMPNRIVNVASDGFSLDTSGNPPCAERDFRATTLGPAPLFKPVADEFWIIKNGI
jgi:hypothetical protein